jgi:hypothetical protein
MTDVATATVLGGFWPNNGVSSLASIAGALGDDRKLISQMMDGRSLRSLRARIRALNGAAPGATATATVAEIDGSTPELGGVRTINTVNLINRATTSADVTEINNTLADILTGLTTFGNSPPANLDGNPLGTR